MIKQTIQTQTNLNQKYNIIFYPTYSYIRSNTKEMFAGLNGYYNNNKGKWIPVSNISYDFDYPLQNYQNYQNYNRKPKI